MNTVTAEHLLIQTSGMDKEWDGTKCGKKECFPVFQDEPTRQELVEAGAAGSAVLPLDHAAPLPVCLSILK